MTKREKELEDLYPNLTPKERENAFVKEKKTVFIMQIGDLLKSGGRMVKGAYDRRSEILVSGIC